MAHRPDADHPGAAPRGGSGAMFDAIAHRYDLLNRLTSLGLDQRWRRRAVDALALPAGARVLDLATGTGDLALAILARRPDSRVWGLDPSAEMLVRCGAKAARGGVADRLALVRGDATALPWPDASFDGVTIAFGIRNVPDRPRALAEMARVTRPGGRVVVLELGEPRSGALAALARLHIRQVVPRLGGWLSGRAEYRYLQTSIAGFPAADEFAATIAAAGIGEVEVTPLSFGVCNLYAGRPGAAARSA
jgi:demethylmenaquinone methyltransferase/2-methoxy-6-polyprenyl-1,4-benzoquinol methylase